MRRCLPKATSRSPISGWLGWFSVLRRMILPSSQLVRVTRRGLSTAMGAGRLVIEVLADAVLQQADVHDRVRLGDARPAQEVVDGGGGVAPSAHADERGHAGVVPAGDEVLLDQAAQVALGELGVRHVEARKLDLPRAGGQAAVVADPVVERAVNLILQGAERVRPRPPGSPGWGGQSRTSGRCTTCRPSGGGACAARGRWWGRACRCWARTCRSWPEG